MENYLEHLNPQQRDAVLYCDGPQLVIAGAGSGKTRVLTYKIVHLLAHGYEPWRILALTFTNKAAREMRQRIEDTIDVRSARQLWMGTFHSIFARILRQHADRIGYSRDYTIYDTADSRALLKSILRDLDLDEKQYKPATVHSAISWAKNALISPEAYARNKDLQAADLRSRRPQLYLVYDLYCKRLRAANAMDFDDLLYFTNVLLRDNPDVLRHYQERFRYILVDEYQDTNFAQHAIIKQLTREGGKLCVVGDDAQSIYSFRGANINNILTLEKVYPGLRIFKLEQNYRSTQNIVDAANSLIDKNRHQIRKNVFSTAERGSKIEVASAYSDFEEASLVANRIMQQKLQTADSYEDFAILYRTNAQSRILEESLRKRNIPYRIYGGLSFYQRKEIKDAVAYFRLAINSDDDESLRRVINYPKRGIGDTTVGKLSAAAFTSGVSLWDVLTHLDQYDLSLNRGTVGKLNMFRTVIEGFNRANISGANAAEMAKKIMNDTGMIRELISDRTPESISKRENLEQLIAGATEFVEQALEEGREHEVSLTDFMTLVSLATDQDEKDGEGPQERVTMMTVHAAKGLEFGNIIVVGVEDDLFPSAMSKESPEEVEEERRLLYVAITRAKRFCMLSYARSRFRNGQTMSCVPSPFLRDIDGAYLQRFTGSDTAREGVYDPFTHRSDAMRPDGWLSRGTGRSGSRHTTVLRSFGGSSSPSPSPMTKSGAKTHDARELRPGMRIAHDRFGEGEIVKIDTTQPDARITVNFDNSGSHTLMLKFARFNIL